ncbi:MAG TPA: hypothetical protein PK812_09925 [Beijerinckiaceae bacterium]|nr:hypothetical protein [Beijerinckiaceae bacterium]
MSAPVRPLPAVGTPGRHARLVGVELADESGESLLGFRRQGVQVDHLATRGDQHVPIGALAVADGLALLVRQTN